MVPTSVGSHPIALAHPIIKPWSCFDNLARNSDPQPQQLTTTPHTTLRLLLPPPTGLLLTQEHELEIIKETPTGASGMNIRSYSTISKAYWLDWIPRYPNLVVNRKGCQYHPLVRPWIMILVFMFSFSLLLSPNFFPFFWTPNNNPLIFLEFISGSYHFAALQLTVPLHFLAPQLEKDWKNHASPEALGLQK